MIGVHDNHSNHSKGDLVKQQFRDEAAEVSRHMSSVHHARKLAYMQVDYSSTVDRLSNFQGGVPLAIIPPKVEEVPLKSKNSAAAIISEKEFLNSMKESIVNERFMNGRKRMYNREMGRKAVVNEVLNGGGPPGKDYIFPQKATHNQILAMTGSLKASRADIVPPAVPIPKKWLGDGVGWSAK